MEGKDFENYQKFTRHKHFFIYTVIFILCLCNIYFTETRNITKFVVLIYH